MFILENVRFLCLTKRNITFHVIWKQEQTFKPTIVYILFDFELTIIGFGSRVYCTMTMPCCAMIQYIKPQTNFIGRVSESDMYTF